MADVTSAASVGTSISATIFESLDVGSGMNSPKLALDLTNAEKMPRQNAINADIEASEVSVSGFALLSSKVSELQTAFEALNDSDELSTATGTSSDSTKMSLSSVTGSAIPGSYNFTVSQLAQNQRTISDQFSSATATINGGTDFDLSLSVGATQEGTFSQDIDYLEVRAALNSGNITVSDGTNSFSVSMAQVETAQGVVSGSGLVNTGGLVLAMTAHAPSGFQFDFAQNSTSDGIDFTQKTAGTGTLTSNSGVVTAGITAATPVTGVAAVYSSALTPSVTGTLAVSDGTTTVSIDSATYANVAAQVTAIQAGANYDELLFTVAANGNNIEITYKTTGLISTAPAVTVGGSASTITTATSGVTAVNSPVVTTIPISTTTPAGVVAAINNANKGVQATLVDTGNDGTNYRIMLSGTNGADNVFSVTSSTSDDLGFGDTDKTLQVAQDSIIDYEGLTITRSSNQISDVIAGATISLDATTSTSVRLNIASDTSLLKTNISNVVTIYNELQSLVTNLGTSDDASEDDMNGALAENFNMLNQLKSSIRTAIFADSGTGSGSITALRSVGISLDQTGKMTFSETTFSTAIEDSYSDVVSMLTGDTTDQNPFDTAEKGLSQDIATLLEGLTDSTGIITVSATNASSNVLDYQDELANLEERMEVVYQRYLAQFAAMETIMASMDTTKDYLKGQLESLSKAYDK